MSHNNEIEYARNKYKTKNNVEWMNDPVYNDFTLAHLKSVHKYHQSIPGYQETPLVDLKQLAKDIGVGKVHVKDESKRFNLNAFKVLGASYSLAKELVGKSEEGIQKGIYIQYSNSIYTTLNIKHIMVMLV